MFYYCTGGCAAPNGVTVASRIGLLVAIGTKLVDPLGGIQVGKWAVHDEEAPWNDTYVAYMTK